MSGFSKQERLLKRVDFLRVSRQGRKLHTTNFVVMWQVSALPAARIGITVSRKVGNAVTRNRLKRLIREFYRQHKHLFRPADYTVIAKHGAALLAHREVCRELASALQRQTVQQC